MTTADAIIIFLACALVLSVMLNDEVRDDESLGDR